MAPLEVIWTVVQARLGSTRLPRKVLAPLGGKLLIDHVVERAEQIRHPVCVAFPHTDDELARLCQLRGWTTFRGPEGKEDDVLGLYTLAADTLGADHVVRVTGDCPFLDVEAARWTLAYHLETRPALTTYHHAEGRGVQVFTREALRNANAEALPSWRHSPDVWILHPYHRFRVETMKFSVDTPDDLERARRRVAA